MPTILHPLINAAAHVVKPKWIWLEAADLDGLFGGSDVSAVLAIGHAGLELIAPPVLRLRSASRGIFPFGFAWEPIGLVCCTRKPGNELLGIAPVYVRDRRVTLAVCHRTRTPWLLHIRSIRARKSD